MTADHRTDEPEMIVCPRIEAAANWLMSDDSAYAASPDNARRAAQEMLDAADLADEIDIGPRLAKAQDRAIAVLNHNPSDTYAAFCNALCEEMGMDADDTELRATADRILARLYVSGYLVKPDLAAANA
jgi:hypothetical protein